MKLITRIQLTREEAIAALLAIRTQWNDNDGHVLTDALESGREGFNIYSNEELAGELKSGDTEVLQQLNPDLAVNDEVDYLVTGDMTDTEIASRKQYRMGDKYESIRIVLNYVCANVAQVNGEATSICFRAREALTYIDA